MIRTETSVYRGSEGRALLDLAVPSAPRRTSLLAIFNNTETARDGFHITVVLAVDASDGEQQLMRLWRRARSRWRP